MSRAFLYLMVERCGVSPVPSVFMVHRINPSRLFFSNNDDQPLPESAEIKARLPRPALSLYPSLHNTLLDFALFGRNKDKIVAMDYYSRSVLYDDALRAVAPLPSMKEFQNYHIFSRPREVWLPVGDHLFVMNNPALCYTSSTSVLALVSQEHRWRDEPREPHMFWQPMPPPPYVKKPEYDPDASHDDCVEAYTVVGESQVWISMKNSGTYSLDMKKFRYDLQGNEMSRGEWSKVADWVLPFYGPAVYAPELNLWFGLSERDDSDESILCAADLHQGATQPPIVSHEWECFTVPKAHFHVSSTESFLVHLGTGGRFCIAKFSTTQRHRDMVSLTGVEVAPCGDGKALRLVRHKTYRYGLGKNYPICVL